MYLLKNWKTLDDVLFDVLFCVQRTENCLSLQKKTFIKKTNKKALNEN